jgi:hypothetical protein
MNICGQSLHHHQPFIFLTFCQQKEVCQAGWENPMEDWIVVNTDGARKLNNASGCGGTMRGRTGEWCGGFARGL